MSTELSLNIDRSAVSVNGVDQIKVREKITYKPADSEKLHIGHVEEFKAAPKSPESIWMRVIDVVDNSSNWLSCSLWLEQKSRGMFNAAVIIEQQTTTNQQPKQNDKGSKHEMVSGADLW